MRPFQKYISRHAAVIIASSFIPCLLAYGLTPDPSFGAQAVATVSEAAAATHGTSENDYGKSRKHAELTAMMRKLSVKGTEREGDATDFRKIGFTYTEDMYLQLSGNDTVPDNWEAEMDPLIEELIEEENEFQEESGTDDGAKEKTWEPVNALDASLYAWANSSTDELPLAADAARAAQKRLGFPYSQPRRDSGVAYDCSSLVYWAYRDAGINLDPVSCHTAASIAAYQEACGREISGGDLKAGDLIFYSYKQNGRYKNISHVAMVCDNGLMVQASSTLGHVVMSEISLSKAVSIVRPVSEDTVTGGALATPSDATDEQNEYEPAELLNDVTAAQAPIGAAQSALTETKPEEYGPGCVIQEKLDVDTSDAIEETQDEVNMETGEASQGANTE